MKTFKIVEIYSWYDFKKEFDPEKAILKDENNKSIFEEKWDLFQDKLLGFISALKYLNIQYTMLTEKIVPEPKGQP